LLFLAALPENPADLATIPRDENGCLPVIKVKDKFEAEYSYITSDGDSFVFKTNCNAPNNRVVRFTLDKSDEADWTDIVPETEHVLSFATVSNNNALLVCHMEHVNDVFRHYDLNTGEKVRDIKMPGKGSLDAIHSKRDTNVIFFKFSTFTDPGSSWSYDPDTGDIKLWRRAEVQGLDLEAFTVDQVFVPSKDGSVKIPMFIVRSKDHFEQNGNNVCKLYGYGGFNVSLTPWFSAFTMTQL
jgi:prolyl oligopeptidase